MDTDTTVAREAGRRWRERSDERTRKKSALETSGVAGVESKERMSRRLDHLAETATREKARRALAAPGAVDREQLAVARLVTTVGLERVIGKKDFLGIEFLELALAVSRFVGRIQVRSRPGPAEGYGTGFMVSPQLLLTNNHVLRSAAEARYSEVEFDYQNDRYGRPLPVVTYALDPATFFVTDPALDFALVAVSPRSQGGNIALKRYGWSRLIGAEGKALHGDPLNIIQHPRGEPKQIVLRSNELVDLLDVFAHYVTDTEPGSSGSPVYNDQFEVVALHHSGVPATDAAGNLLDVDGNVWRDGMDPARIQWVANEGIRVSRLVAHLRSLQLPPAQAKLRDDMLELEPPHPFEAALMASADTALTAASGNGNGGGAAVTARPQPAAARPVARTWTIPIHVSVDLGAPFDADGVSAHATTPLAAEPRTPIAPAAARPNGAGSVEAIAIDPDYTSRQGYRPTFLGANGRRVPLPRLTEELRADAAVNREPSGDDDTVLPYHHFSVVMNKRRRLAFFTAVNVDGTITHNFRRERDRWFRDPRIGADEQTGEDLYAGNELDRGHLVRRLDPSWGSSRQEAKHANDDTFHFTNCSPQHATFNQGKTLWAGLEDYILKNADLEDLKVSVFTGPVFGDSDREYRGVQLPASYWKVVVIVKADGTLSATAYLLSQKSLIADIEEAYTYGAYRTYQVPVSHIEELTSLDFGPLRGADPLRTHEGLREETAVVRGREVAIPAREIGDYGEIQL
jgi:endonuclease G